MEVTQRLKYSLTKSTKKQALVELFMMLSDSIDENIPDIIWEGSEFEVDIKQDDISCEIQYIDTKKGGEFSVKISWITTAAKKQKAAEAAKKTKEKIEKKTATAKSTAKTKSTQPIEIVQDEELWSEEGEGWDISDSDEDWDAEDYDDEW